MAPLFETLKEELRGLNGIQVVELEELQQQKHQPFMCDKTCEDTMSKPILILHSSGSTGTHLDVIDLLIIAASQCASLPSPSHFRLAPKDIPGFYIIGSSLRLAIGVPKPITMTHGTFATFDYCRNLPTVPGRRKNDFTLWDSTYVRRFYSAFPPSHLAGFLSMIIVPIFSEASCPVLGPPLRPPSGQLVKEIMEKQRLKSLFIPPAVAEQILQEPAGLEFFRGLDFMYTAGGPLSQAAGDLISGATSVCQLYGSTETSQIPMLVPLPEDWAYMEFHPSLKLEMRPTGSEDGVCELVHHMDSTTEKVAALNHNFPGVAEYATRDLFMPHATKHGLWRFHGRIDDVIVLSNGEKFFPVPMETKLSGHPSLSGALVLGQGQFQAALLLEPKVAITDAASFADEIWPFVEEANSLVPGQGRITRSKILVASSDKPFQRAPKGTIVRSLTTKAYEQEINALYADKIPNYSPESVPKLKATFELSTIEHWVRSIVLQAFPIMANASNTDDMFVLGLDSLRTFDILGMLKAALGSHRDTSELHWLSSMIIYSNPTIRQLAAVIAGFLNSDTPSGKGLTNGTKEHRTVLIGSLVEKYTRGLMQRTPFVGQSSQTDYVVAVTGTTGSLGTRIVQQLSRNPRITKIICLDRGQDARQRHRQAKLQLDESKLEYFSIKLGEVNLGLSEDTYARLSSEVDVIIHNAWKVDFSQILESYEADHIRGVRALIDWSLSSIKHPRILFISSISSVSNLTTHNPGVSVQEALINNNDAPAKMGYAESKFVAENMLGTAATEAKIPITILRVGQIAGSTSLEDPPWPIQEWFPSLVKTSKALGLLPNELPPVDWVPIDKLASTITELMLHDVETGETEIYNLVNPHPVPWTSLMEAVQAYCGLDTKEASLKDWIERLRALPENKDEVVSKPALKMLNFFEQMAKEQLPPRFQTKRSESASRTMAAMEPVNGEWMRIWLDQWVF